MKIIKKILITLVLLLSLFFNTSTIFAGNNLSTTFNANNDELTVTVKNNSDKELSDVEYNLNLPNEYTAKYKVNPDYSLSPQKETTFKVKVSKVGNDVSNNGEKGTKTFTSSKKSLDNTGLTSELAVGAIVVLFLLVGVLLYFKQRKVFIILLMAGLGTQLTPRYSLASEKIRQSENFKDNVSLLEKNISVSLDISYLIEDNQNNESNKKVDSDSSINKNDSKENSNDVDKKNNNENKSDNGITNSDNVPKEVVAAGFAYSGKTNNVLEEKELKVFDGDKEIATVKTDAEGYFFTHLIQEKTYTIKGEDFEVTVTAKNTGDYEHNDVVGKITLGRVQEDEYTKIKFKPSVAFISEDIGYTVRENSVVIEREYKFKKGDKLVLAPNHDNLTGLAVIVDSSKTENGKTILSINRLEELDEILDDLEYNETFNINSMKLIPEPGVEIREDSSDSLNRNSWSINRLTIPIKMDINGKPGYVEGSVIIEGNVGADIKLSEKKMLIKPDLKISGQIKVGVESKIGKEYKLDKSKLNLNNNFNEEKKFATLLRTTYMGILTKVELYLVLDAKGEVNILFKYGERLQGDFGYKNGLYKNFKISDKTLDLSLNFYGNLFTGPKFSTDFSILNAKLGEIYVKSGLEVEGFLQVANVNLYGKDSFFKLPFAEMYGKAFWTTKVGASLDLIKKEEDKKEEDKKEEDKKVRTPEYMHRILIKDFRDFINKDNIGDGKTTDSRINMNNLDIYKNIIEKYKKAIKDRGTDDSRINMSAIDLSYTPVLYKLGEKRMTYGYYDINGDGQDELIIFGSQGIADIYTIDFNDGVSKLLPEKGAYGVSLHPQITKDNKVVITGTEGGNDVGFDKHIFDVYDFEKNSRSLRLLTSVEGIGKTFNRVYPNKEQMSLQDFINNYEKKYKQNIVDLSNINKTTLIDKDTDSSENIDHVGGYSNAQLALIGRVLVNAVTPTEGVALRGLTMRKNGNSYITGLGNAASDVMVERTVNGISVLTPKYSAVGEEKKFEEKARYSYDELSNIIGENTLDEINDLIKSLKEIGTYKVEEFEG